MKNKISIFVFWVGFEAFAYLLVTFVTWEVNPALWSDAARAAYAMLFVIGVIIFTGAIANDV